LGEKQTAALRGVNKHANSIKLKNQTEGVCLVDRRWGVTNVTLIAIFLTSILESSTPTLSVLYSNEQHPFYLNFQVKLCANNK